MSSAEPDLLFVYGTLRPALAGGDVARIVRDLENAGTATVPGLLVDLGDYPGLIIGDGIVRGELLGIPDASRLAALDAYEGCGGREPLFYRERTTASRPDGTTVEAWVYRYGLPAAGASVIESGDYAAHLARK